MYKPGIPVREQDNCGPLLHAYGVLNLCRTADRVSSRLNFLDDDYRYPAFGTAASLTCKRA